MTGKLITNFFTFFNQKSIVNHIGVAKAHSNQIPFAFGLPNLLYCCHI